ncbi:MAG TPA: hypothetical protein VN903_31915, partial [Polyangia bacterium]|nr:hypothetical protein [Polyangia bacterium]
DPTKWAQAVAALNQVVGATNAGVSWGLKSFPEDGAECANSTVTTRIDVPVAATNASAINTAIASLAPTGNGTPTGAAIDVARSYVQTLTDAKPRYLLLVTDGIPGCAGTVGDLTKPGTAMSAAYAVKEIAAAASAGLHTFVIGIEDQSASAVDTLNQMAMAGGEPRLGANPLTTRFYQAVTTSELVAALQTITGNIVSCRFPLSSVPPAPANVTVSVGGTQIPRDTAGANGWDYSIGGNSEIRVYGSWCDTIRASAANSVQIVYGCASGAGGAGGGAGTLLMSDDFEAGNANGWMTDSATTNGVWAVVSDGANHVYQQSADINTRVWSVAGVVGWTDQRVEARVKFATLPATTLGAGMVAARFQDLSNYYFVRLVPDGRVTINIRNAGSASELAVNGVAGRTPLTAGTWYTLALAARGTTLTAYLDGAAVVTTTDTSFASGGIGVGTDHCTASFDDVKVTLP